MVSKQTVSIVFCFAFLALAEMGIRLLDPGFGGRDDLVYEADRPVFLSIGTSRSLRGIAPAIVEEELAIAGVDRPWVANIHELGATNIGLLKLYMETIHPWAHRTEGAGIIAIETRGSAMNDNYMVKEEKDWLGGDEEGILPTVAALPAMGLGTSIRNGDFDGVARKLIRKSRLARGMDYINGLCERRRLIREERSGTIDLVSHMETFEWGGETRGWEPYRQRRFELEIRQWERRYKNVLLKDYEIGGVQSDALGILIRQVIADGWTPVLYLMPITNIHKRFYKEGEYESFLEEVRRIAEETGVPFIDLDTDHSFDRTMFRDTHHLVREGAEVFSRLYARRVLLPLVQ